MAVALGLIIAAAIAAMIIPMLIPMFIAMVFGAHGAMLIGSVLGACDYGRQSGDGESCQGKQGRFAEVMAHDFSWIKEPC